MVAGSLMDTQGCQYIAGFSRARLPLGTAGMSWCKLGALGGWEMSYLRNQPYDEKDFPAFDAIREQLGFLPNFFVEQTARPDMVETEIAMTGNLILKEGALPRRQKEYIFLVCSAANL